MDQEICKDLATPASCPSGIRAAVIVPPVSDFYFTPHRFSCLGAQVVCRILSECGIPFVFFNFPLMKRKPQVIDIPEEIKYLQDHIIPHELGKLSYFTKYQRFGPVSNECARLVTDSCPSICFISCFAYSHAKEAIDLACDIKKIKPDLPIVIGGAGVSAYPLYFIRDTNIDFAIVGEAEISLKPFCKALFERTLSFDLVPNLFQNRTHPFVPPLQYSGRHLETFNQMTAPNLKIEGKNSKDIRTIRFTSSNEIMPIIAKVHEKKKSVYFSVSLTRGCEKQCRFCSNFLAHGHGFRVASFDSVALMVNNVSIDQKKHFIVNFEDDNLLYAPEFLLKVMRLFSEKFSDVTFLAENGIDYNLLTPFLADELIHAGMSKFNFTLGSITDHVLIAQDRKGSKTHFESIVRHIALKSIPVLSYFICGLKSDTKESVADILAYLHSLPTQIGISMFYAVPGLPDFTDLEQFDKFHPVRCNGTSAYSWYGKEGLTNIELVTSFRLSRYINLMKSCMKSEIELQLIEKIRKEKKLFTLKKNKQDVEIIPVPGLDNELVRMVLKRLD
jgi:hypothetical protein